MESQQKNKSEFIRIQGNNIRVSSIDGYYVFSDSLYIWTSGSSDSMEIAGTYAEVQSYYRELNIIFKPEITKVGRSESEQKQD